MIFRIRQVGLIYQFYNLTPILNVEENITLPLDLDNKKVNQKELAYLITLLSLKNLCSSNLRNKSKSYFSK